MGRRALLKLLGLLCGAVVWEAVGRAASPLTFAPLSQVLVSLSRLGQTWEFWGAFAVSLQSMLSGFVTAAIIGIIIGLAMAGKHPWSKPLDIYMSILITLPMAAVIPLVVIALGIATSARAFVVFLFAFPIIAVNTAAGVGEVDPGLLEMARSLNAGRWLTTWRIIMPGALPATMAGLRLGLGRALVGMVSAELLLMSAGIGNLVDLYSATFQVADLWALLLVLLLLGAVTLGAVQFLERRLIHWRPAELGGRRKGTIG